MPLKLLYTDLTRFPCDAAVIAADESLQYGGSVFGACGSRAGMSLTDELRALGGCAAGEAKTLRSRAAVSGLSCKKLIVTAAPVWRGGDQHETETLADCYRHSLEEAAAQGCRKIAVSLIDSGVYGFPKDIALETAVQTILSHPLTAKLDVYLVRFDWHSYGAHWETLAELEQYLAKRLSPQEPRQPLFGGLAGKASSVSGMFRKEKKSDFAASAYMESGIPAECAAEKASLDERLKQLDEGFTEMLLRLIDERGMSDAECYKKANLSKQLFSKIRSKPHYRPQKETAIALALALKLDLESTNALLRTAGLSLSHSSKFDVIIEYFIDRKIYNVFEINEALEQYDQPLLGSE
ncbi:MAG: macro domain-containing protein [Oscillospiraceae bacterium]|nr:macro domain-containing protein [Oscillospiraceae bacterium]